MNIYLLLAFLGGTAITVIVLMAKRISAYKRDWEFFREERRKRAVRAARIINQLALNNEWLKYVVDRAEKHAKARGDLDQICQLVQFVVDDVENSYENDVIEAVRFSIDSLKNIISGS